MTPYRKQLGPTERPQRHQSNLKKKTGGQMAEKQRLGLPLTRHELRKDTMCRVETIVTQVKC